MQYIDSSISSPKLTLVSEPWNKDDYSYKNRATLNVYADSLNVGFSVWLNHPNEVGKKIEIKGQQRNLSNFPVQCRMDRVRFTILMNSLIRLAEDKEYPGKTIKCLNFWYDNNGDVILTDGKKKPCHTSTVQVGRDENGVIYLAVREEKHPLKESARPGVKFKIDSGTWFNNCDNETTSELTPGQDSEDNAKALAENWKETMFICLNENYKQYIQEKAKKREQYKSAQGQQQSSASQSNNGGSAWS